MPHEWRSPARWLGSPNVWALADRARRRAAMVGAFVDRTSIDWSAALKHAADPHERALVDGLRRLESLRGSARPTSVERTDDPWVWPLAAATALGIAQVLCILMLAGPGFMLGAATFERGLHLVLALAFSAASLSLGAAALRDDRAFLLLGTFVLAASAFTRALLNNSSHGGAILSTPLFHGLYPEAFAAAALWKLAVVFPSVRRFTALDVFARRGATFAWILAAGLCGANLVLAYLPETLPIEPLSRDHPGNLYWRVFAATALPAVAIILLRAHRAPRIERMKVIRFAGAIALGAGPFLIVGAARSIPSVDAWMRSLTVRMWMDPVVLITIAAMPVLTSIAVLIDAPFECSSMMGRRAARDAMVFQRRFAFVTRKVRRRRLQEQLSAAVDRLRLARGSRELIDVLGRELESVLASTVAVVGAEALPSGTALALLLTETTGAFELCRDREPFVLLPREDREWLDARGVGLAAAVRLRDGAIAAVVLVGQPPTGDGFGRPDRWFVSTLVLAAAAAWPPADERVVADDPADECTRCGRVRAPGPSACCPGAATKLASLPHELAGKYTIVRRLGAGGMGVVYLGEDRTLGRDVALKTLRGLRDGAVPRLRAEARVMAALNHPSIATIYGVEIWRGTPVLVVEYFPRGTLADALAAGPLPVDDVLRFGVRLADALACVHARNLLHRDVKPGNIGLASGGVAKLLDFGLAGAEDYRAGTTAYVSPEVLAGAPPDAAMDLWALAVVIRDACVPDDRVAAFLDRALARKAADRYRSSQQMRAALRRLLGAADDGR